MDDSDPGTQRARILRVATRCTSSDQFVEAFARFCDERTLFVSSLSTRPIGTQLPFVILLADGTRAMRGQCEVIESYATPGNAYRRPGVKLALAELDEDSEAMLTRLQEARRLRDARHGHQPATSGGIELATESRAQLSPANLASAAVLQPAREGTRAAPPPPPRVASAPPPAPSAPPPVRAVGAPPPPPSPPPRAASSRLPALPRLPRLGGERPGEPPARRAPATTPSRLAPLPPLGAAVEDPTDAGWGDDDAARPPRLRTAPVVPAAEPAAAPAVPAAEPAAAPVVPAAAPVVAAPDPAAAAPAIPAAEPAAAAGVPEDDSAPAMIVAAAPDRAAAAAAASREPTGPVAVVELIQRAHARDSGAVPRAVSSAASGSGRVAVARPTPGDVYSPEERTPGSSFILPANPLSNLTDEALQGFIDVTIYEDSTVPEPVASDPAISGSELGMVEEEPDPVFKPIVSHAADAPRSGSRHLSGELSVPPLEQLVELVRRAPSQPLASIDNEDEEDDHLPPAAPPPVIVAPEVHVRAATPPPVPPIEPAQRARRPTPPPPPLPPPPRDVRPSSRPDWLAPAPDSDPAVKAAPAGTARPRAATVKPPRGRSVMPTPAERRWLVPFILLCLVVAAAVLFFLRHRQQGKRSPAGGGAGAVVVRDAGVGARPPIDAGVAVVVVDAAVAAPPVDAAVATAPIDAAVASSTCRVQVITAPGGAAVTIDRRGVGSSPVDAEVACGSVAIAARLAQYQPAARRVTLAPGAPAVVRIRLARPMHDLTVVSTPVRATVKIDGRKVGLTPLSTTVSGFSRHVVTIELPGYQIYRTTIQTDDLEQTVAAPLVPLP